MRTITESEILLGNSSDGVMLPDLIFSSGAVGAGPSGSLVATTVLELYDESTAFGRRLRVRPVRRAALAQLSREAAVVQQRGPQRRHGWQHHGWQHHGWSRSR